jgi:hypothetical protein
MRFPGSDSFTLCGNLNAHIQSGAQLNQPGLAERLGIPQSPSPRHLAANTANRISQHHTGSANIEHIQRFNTVFMAMYNTAAPPQIKPP